MDQYRKLDPCWQWNISVKPQLFFHMNCDNPVMTESAAQTDPTKYPLLHTNWSH